MVLFMFGGTYGSRSWLVNNKHPYKHKGYLYTLDLRTGKRKKGRKLAKKFSFKRAWKQLHSNKGWD